jgi:Zn-dependent protease with chaperone function
MCNHERVTRWGLIGMVVLGLIAASTVVAGAAKRTRDPEFEQRITDELRAIAPDAAPLFAEATRLTDAGDPAGAERLLHQVLALAPRFDHAVRRLCGAELDQGKTRQGLAHCREALAMRRSPENLVTTAVALLSVDPVPQADIAVARNYAREAVRGRPDDPALAMTAFMVAAAVGDRQLMASTRPLVEQLPEGPEVLAIGDKMIAERSRGLALELAPREDALDVDWADVRPFVLPVIVGYAAVGALMLLLLVLGFILSRLTLGAISRRAETAAAAADPADTSAGERSLRRVYRLVLWLTSALYYVSIPLLLIGVLALGIGLIGAFVVAGTIPVGPVIFIVVATFATVAAIARGLMARSSDEEPGLRLDERDHPKVRRLLDEVAFRVDTRPVDTVYLTPGTDIAVFERAGVLGQLRGRSRRYLILGVGVLDGMKLGELRSILAHEYGHFRNQDTAGGAFALGVRRALMITMINLAASGAARWWNPSWWFLLGFFKMFLRISHGATRLQEVQADRWAAVSYGSAAFEAGLMHVIRREVAFEAHTDVSIREAVEHNRPLTNLYQHAPQTPPNPDEVTSAIDAALDRPPSPYDSHPAPRQRLAWVRALAAPGKPAADDDHPAWDLFDDRAQLELSMTEKVRQNVLDSHGVVIPGRPAPLAAPDWHA